MSKEQPYYITIDNDETGQCGVIVGDKEDICEYVEVYSEKAMCLSWETMKELLEKEIWTEYTHKKTVFTAYVNDEDAWLMVWCDTEKVLLRRMAGYDIKEMPYSMLKTMVDAKKLAVTQHFEGVVSNGV